MPSTKSTNFGNRRLVEGFSELDEIWKLNRGGLAIYHHPDWWTLAQKVPWGAKILNDVKKLQCFSRTPSDRAQWNLYVAGHLLFLWTLVHFCGSTNFQQRISCTILVVAQRNLAALGGLANGHVLPKFGELRSTGPAIPCGDMHQSFTDALVYSVARTSVAYY